MKRILSLILGALLITPAYGAFGAGTVWRVSTVSSAATNGGGYDPGVVSPGTDESSSAGVAITITTASTTTGTGSPAITSTTHGPGNFIHIASGTGCTVGWYEILSQSAGTATFDHAIAAAGGDTCVGTIGGPVAAIGTASAITVSGNTICVKADGTYSVGSQISLASGGGSAALPLIVQGYTTTCGIGATPGDGGKATLQITANSIVGLSVSVADVHVYNFIVDINSHTSVNGISSTQTGNHFENLLVENMGASSIGFTISGSQNTFANIRVTGGLASCGNGFKQTNGQSTLVGVIIDTSACTGFNEAVGGMTCIYCIAANNTGATTDGFNWSSTNAEAVCIGCISYGNGRNGFNYSVVGAAAVAIMWNNWAWGNSAASFNSGSAIQQQILFDYNAYASGSLSNITAGQHDVVLTADPSTAGASLNFTLNNTTGGGAAIKGAGFPSRSFFSSTAYATMGAIPPLVNSTANLGGANAFVQ